MKAYHIGLATALLLGASQSAMALNFTFDYTFDDSGFFDSVERRSVLEKSGEYWGSRISDNLTAAISSEPGVRSYDVDIRHPSTGELNFSNNNLKNFSVQENEYKIFVGARDLNIGDPDRSILGKAGFGGFGNIHGDSDYIENVRTRGQAGVNDTPPTDFQRWGGWISFDDRDASEWYFDLDTSTFNEQDKVNSANKFDFFSTALHEIGHVLGFSSGSEPWLTNVGEVQNNIPNGPEVGTKVFIGDDAFSLSAAAGDFFIELDVDENGDLTGHFENNTNGLGGGLDGQTDTLMDPSAVNGHGTRKLPTNLDFAAFRDVGWEISASPVPVPAAVWLFGTSLLGLLGFKKRHST